jgi:hypothetical protein
MVYRISKYEWEAVDEIQELTILIAEINDLGSVDSVLLGNVRLG